MDKSAESGGDDPRWLATYEADPPFGATLLEAWSFYGGSQDEFVAELERLATVLRALPEDSGV
jgi:hypothetical protein